jgi:hypothetical protein
MPSFADRVRGLKHVYRSLHIPPRWLRYALVGLCAVLVSLVFGITTASTEASLGPHNARYEVTTNSIVAVDIGPLGTIQLDSPLPLTLGVTATIEEIPNDLTSVDSVTTLNALATDVQGYLQFFSGPAATISYVAKALLQDAALRAGVALGVIVVVGVLGYVVLGSARRRELGPRLAQATWPVAAGLVVVLAVGGVVVANRANARQEAVSADASSVFDGTALEGARITGRLSGVIETYGAQVIGVYRSNKTFYEDADSNVKLAWLAREEETVRRDALLAANGVVGAAADTGIDSASPADEDTSPGQTPSEETPADETSSDEATEATPTTSPEGNPEDIVTMLMVSDLHCNVGMSPLITTVATLSGASIILNGGDTTISGTAVERFCVDSFVGSAPDGVAWVQADGNHDSSETSEQARAAGATVLNGSIVEVAGIRILGDSDPNQTRLGQGSTSAHGETYEEAGERLRDVACEAGDPADILLIHTPTVGVPVLASGCVAIQLSGHQHARSGPTQYGQGIRYVSSTTAGAAEGQATIGPLNGVSEMTVFRYDRERHLMLDYQIIAVRPDGSASVGERLSFPVIPSSKAGRSSDSVSRTATDGASDDSSDMPSTSDGETSTP